MEPTTQQTIDQFIERMGLASQAEGMPRIAGRMMGLFIIHGGPCSFSELAERLAISRGSVSTNARLLETLGVIERLTRAGDRQDYFQLTRDPFGRLLEGYVERMRRIESSVKTAQEELPGSWIEAHGRLREMAKFYHAAIDNTLNLIQRWREEHQKTPV